MKNVLITGANKSIGFETARQLLQNGYFVYLGARNLEKGTAAADKLKAEGLINVEAIQLDVSNIESVLAARKTIGERTGVLDALINNAGINGGFPQSALEASVDQFKHVFGNQFIWRCKGNAGFHRPAEKITGTPYCQCIIKRLFTYLAQRPHLEILYS